MMGLVSVNHGISITTRLTLFQFEHDNIAVILLEGISLKRAVYLIKQRDRQLLKSA
ncbi:hypothetical protein J3U56_00115 [Gilliamella sp. B2824]|uniref:hypothetical protein n=1 Tax=Gilliamella sp. B2824 TaxID=2818019 RepID=UPI00226A1439|nr:hypothetical protein [Gilliamella sp. B2824]MCX8737731.1 hypothetical protein [Gilliamella sp. B2824]